jgi:hypothetical protein
MIDDWDRTPDNARRERLGFDETALCAGKPPAEIDRLALSAMEAAEPLRLTRLAPEEYTELSERPQARLDYDPLSQRGREEGL